MSALPINHHVHIIGDKHKRLRVHASLDYAIKIPTGWFQKIWYALLSRYWAPLCIQGRDGEEIKSYVNINSIRKRAADVYHSRLDVQRVCASGMLGVLETATRSLDCWKEKLHNQKLGVLRNKQKKLASIQPTSRFDVNQERENCQNAITNLETENTWMDTVKTKALEKLRSSDHLFPPASTERFTLDTTPAATLILEPDGAIILECPTERVVLLCGTQTTSPRPTLPDPMPGPLNQPLRNDILRSVNKDIWQAQKAHVGTVTTCLLGGNATVYLFRQYDRVCPILAVGTQFYPLDDHDETNALCDWLKTRGAVPPERVIVYVIKKNDTLYRFVATPQSIDSIQTGSQIRYEAFIEQWLRQAFPDTASIDPSALLDDVGRLVDTLDELGRIDIPQNCGHYQGFGVRIAYEVRRGGHVVICVKHARKGQGSSATAKVAMDVTGQPCARIIPHDRMRAIWKIEESTTTQFIYDHAGSDHSGLALPRVGGPLRYHNPDGRVSILYPLGSSLSQHVLSQTREERCRTLYPLIQGLTNMHSQHFIHGDIKPSNTLLQKGKAVFCDLGSALAMDSYRYAHHETHTLRFLSPEAATKKEYGQPFDVYDQDVYALGYTLLLFLAPEIGHSLDERMPIHTALSKVRGQISPELYNILHKIIYPESGVRPSIAEVQQVWGQAIGAPPDAPSSATTTTQPATRDKGKRPA